MLAQSVVGEFGGRARFVSENYGDSDLAKRFGVTRYPAIFVEDVLVATPNDFGFYGKGEEAGSGGARYAPLKTAAAHERFRADLSRMIELALAGRKEAVRAEAAPAEAAEIAAFPDVPIVDLDGRSVRRSDLAGRVVVVELWATWCPPCRGTLAWLAEIQKRYGDRVAIVALAVQSEEANVRKVATERKAPFVWAMGSPDLVRAFGDVSAVPTLLVFDRAGRSAAAFYGAPPTLHAEAETRLASLLN